MKTYTAKSDTRLNGPAGTTITVKKGEVVLLDPELAAASPEIWEVNDGGNSRKTGKRVRKDG
jgi:hypothetical protein